MTPDVERHEFTITQHEWPELSAWGTFRMEAFRIDGVTPPAYQYAVLYTNKPKIVAYGGPFPTIGEAMANAQLAMWQYAETGENADHIGGLAHAARQLTVAFADLIPNLSRMMKRGER